MYRIFCESYENFKNSFLNESYRLKIAEPIELLTDLDKFEREKKMKVIYIKSHVI